MGNFNFVYLVGKKVSIAIDMFKPGSHVKETYVGRIRQVFDDFVILEQEQVVNKESNTSNLKEVMLKKDHIVSVWIYNTK